MSMLETRTARILLFGATGRIGRLCCEVLKARDTSYAVLHRNGDLVIGDASIGNIHDGSNLQARYLVVDASIDHRSLQHMQAHENAKLTFSKSLAARHSLAGLIAFSSGAAEFDEGVVVSDWHRAYRNEKLKLESWVESLDCPAYCPRLFVLIGPSSFRAGTTGWVDVVQQVCNGDKIEVGAPDEPRSWVAETRLSAQIDRFLTAPHGPRLVTPLSGIFSLGEIARMVARLLGRTISLEQRKISPWLSVPYVSRAETAFSPEHSLEAVLAPLVASYVLTKTGKTPP